MSQVFPSILRWTARLSAVLIVGAFVVLLAGEVFSPHSGPPSNLREWFGLALITLACIGMVLAWRWEFHGAIISLAALVGFAAVIAEQDMFLITGAISIPPVLYLMDWLLRRIRHYA